jgi:glycosyltransferase involved in cell wall biosynthesis
MRASDMKKAAIVTTPASSLLSPDGGRHPVVSIGFPIYNDQRFGPAALDCLLKQTYTDFELIISDNASTDMSEAFCRGAAVRDARIRYFRQSENIGPSANFNFLLDAARGTYFMWAASDDLWAPDFLQTLVGALIARSNAALAFCPYRYIGQADEALGEVLAFNYSSRSRIVRLWKLCSDYNDACFYGLFRRSHIAGTKVPVWWGRNGRTPINNAYPFLMFALTSGDFVLAGSDALWFNRLRPPRYTVNPFLGHRVMGLLAFFMRKLNVLLFCADSIYRASGSMLLTALALPALSIRLLKDSSEPFRRIVTRVTPGRSPASPA